MTIAADDIGAFEGAARFLVEQIGADPGQARELLAGAFAELEQSGLGADEVTRRARRIAESLPVTEGLQKAVAAAAGSTASPAIRMAAVSTLPPAYMREVY